jgi:hypothetical protein
MGRSKPSDGGLRACHGLLPSGATDQLGVEVMEVRSIFEEYPDLLEPNFIADYSFRDCHSRMGAGAQDFSTLDVAVALIRSEGEIKGSADYLGRSRTATANFVARDRMLRELQSEIEESFLDVVESNARLLALKGDKEMIKFTLQTRGKARGYSTRTETTGPEGGPVQIIHSEMDAKEAAEAYAASLNNTDGA